MRVLLVSANEGVAISGLSLAREIEELVTRQTATDPRVTHALQTGSALVSADDKFDVLFRAVRALYQVELRLANEIEELKAH